MKRRAALTTFALTLSAGCLSPLPRATGPRKPPEAPEGGPGVSSDALSIETWDYSETGGGSLRIFGTIRNSSDVKTTATVAATVTVAGDGHTNSTDITVPAGGTAKFELRYDVSYDKFEQNGSISIELA